MLMQPKIEKIAGLKWVPQRRGAIFCAPACGGKCTYAAWETAHRQAAALAKRMGEGWTTEVYENLGWHWRVVSPNGCLKLHHTPGRFLAFLGEDDIGGRWAEYGDSPETAVEAVIAIARRELKILQRLVRSRVWDGVEPGHRQRLRLSKKRRA